MTDDFNNSDSSSSMFRHTFPILFFPKNSQMGRLLEIFLIRILDKNKSHVFQRQILMSQLLILLTIFGQHRFWANILQIWSEYPANQKVIFSRTDKEYLKMILGESNMKDLIIFDEISKGGRYSIMMNMK